MIMLADDFEVTTLSRAGAPLSVGDQLFRRLPDSTLRSLTEMEMAAWFQQQGYRIARHRGRYWYQSRLGFFESVHWLGRLHADEASWPGPCWGFRASLAEEDADAANAVLPIHLNRNPRDFELSNLRSSTRRDVRSCQRQVEIVEVLDSRGLGDDAYRTYLSAVKRNGYGRSVSRREFASMMRAQVRPELRLVLAGLVAGEVGGYLTASAVEGTAYVDSIVLATEALRTNIGTGLVYEFMQICLGSPGIREVVYGLHAPEDPELCRYKEKLGFAVVQVPSRAVTISGLRALIRWIRPRAGYRLFG